MRIVWQNPRRAWFAHEEFSLIKGREDKKRFIHGRTDWSGTPHVHDFDHPMHGEPLPLRIRAQMFFVNRLADGIVAGARFVKQWLTRPSPWKKLSELPTAKLLK